MKSSTTNIESSSNAETSQSPLGDQKQDEVLWLAPILEPHLPPPVKEGDCRFVRGLISRRDWTD
jgi:hypothetical protein